MCGLQGSGKTTTCGKLAAYLKKKGRGVMLAAADLQRPAAVEQLQTLARQVDQEITGGGRVVFYGEPDKCAEYGKAVGVAVKVCRNALEAARKAGVDVLILDTAGRLHVNDELMDELRQVNRALNPHQIYLVIDAMTGQDAVNSAKAFNDQLELDGVILSKTDSDTRGGAALTVKAITGKPIKFVGTGEKIEALEEFHPQRMAGRILGMGDVVSLVEKAQEQIDQEEAAKLQEKMAKGKMTMDDFLNQLKAVRKMGSMKSLLGMLPGIGSQIKDLDLNDSELDKTEAIIHSMTRQERADADLLNHSRRRRVAAGSGTGPEDVSQLVKGFGMVQGMTKQMAGLSGLQRLRAMASLGRTDLAAMGSRGTPQLQGFKPKDKSSSRKRKERKKKSR
jgi:signal recognition particle subunit SRP54